MAFNSPKAAGRRAPTDVTQKPGSPKKASNQEGFTGTGAKSVSVGASRQHDSTFKGVQRDAGNQVAFAPNPFGTSSLKNPLNSYKSKTLGATTNPGPSGDLARNRKAPGKKPNGAASI